MQKKLISIGTLLIILVLTLKEIHPTVGISGGWKQLETIFPQRLIHHEPIVSESQKKATKEGPGPDGDRYFEFFPDYKATLWPSTTSPTYTGPVASWIAPCYENTEGYVELTETGPTITLKTS